jgi:putative membrane protein
MHHASLAHMERRDGMVVMQADDGSTGKLLRGALAGLIAGAVASFAMDRFQAAVTALSSSGDDGEQQEPATQKAADGLARALTGGDIPAVDKPLAGQAIHYALGIGLGVAYGIAAEFRPSVTAGFGAAFGASTATLLDQGAVPTLGLGQAPWKAGLASNLYGYASHLVFGATTELVRRQVAGTLQA